MYRALTFGALLALSIPVVASAHAFGQQYTLPLPFSLYATGAACALIVSFVIAGFYSAPQRARAAREKILAISPSLQLGFFFRGFGLLIFFAGLIIAFFGNQDYLRNPVPDLFWGLHLLGLTYVTAICAGLWRLMNPFDTITRAFLFFAREKPLFTYPTWLGYWPALVFYYCLIWFELLSSGAGGNPALIGILVLVYLIICIAGSLAFGRDAWFTYGDFFSVFFGLVGRFAPFELTATRFSIRLPGERLVGEDINHISLLVFILFMLSSTAFDGLQDTQVWWDVMYATWPQIVFYLQERSIVLLLSPFIFLALYAAAVYGMKILTGATQTFKAFLLRFAPLLIPIAIAYSFAHYGTLLVSSLRRFIVLVSDPLARGWDLFGTTTHPFNGWFIPAQAVWYTQFSVILGGHIIATYIAHRIALTEFSNRKQLLLGQIPMLVLMVFYTVFGLWILSQAYQSGV